MHTLKYLVDLVGVREIVHFWKARSSHIKSSHIKSSHIAVLCIVAIPVMDRSVCSIIGWLVRSGNSYQCRVSLVLSSKKST